MDSIDIFSKNDIQQKNKMTYEKTLLDEILSRIDTVVILLELDGTIIFVNEAYEKITGIRIEDTNSENFSKSFGSSSLEPIIQGFQYTVKYRKPYVIDKHLVYRNDGREIILKINMDYINLNHEGYIMVAANDLTREEHLSKVKDIVIRLNNMISDYKSLDDYFDDILRSLVEAIPYAELGSILLVDQNDFMTMKANVGYDREMAEKFKLNIKESFFYRNCGDNFRQPVIINDLATYSMDGFADILDNVNSIKVASSLSSPIIIDGKFEGLLNLDSSQNNVFGHEDLEIMQFLTEQISLVLTSHQLLNQTIYLSKFDQLTGLNNRWYIKEFENVTLPHSIRYAEHFYFVVMDINNLKKVNDNLGHMLGDAYLVEFAKLLKLHSRETDILIRVGGDEFVGVYFAIDSSSLCSKMEDINRELSANMKALEVDYNCNFAFGMAAFPEEGQTVNELMRIADQRMYVKKAEMKEEVMQ